VGEKSRGTGGLRKHEKWSLESKKSGKEDEKRAREKNLKNKHGQDPGKSGGGGVKSGGKIEKKNKEGWAGKTKTEVLLF